VAINIAQTSFSAGEFSPTLFSRVDLQKYATGLRRCRNMIVQPEGAVGNRPGTRYVATAKHADKATRVISFEFSVTQAYVIEVGDQYMRFFKDGGQIAAPSA
jgi:hypothetical protein